MVPTINCCYNGDEDKPHLTTFKTGKDKNSIWRIKKVIVDGKAYYHFIHNATGKYIMVNDAIPELVSNNNAHRKRVHLETTSTPDYEDRGLFVIEKDGSIIGISSKKTGSTTKKDGTDHIYLNPQGSSFDSYRETNNPGRSITDFGGIIGFYGKANDFKSTGGSKWLLETANPTCANPVVEYTDDTHIKISYPISSDTNWTIYYTTDGTDPTTSSTRKSTTSDETISATGVEKIRAIATKDGYDPSEESVLVASAPLLLVKSADTEAPFYMIPPVVATDQYATTTNIPSSAIGWKFEPAGLYAGIQYYMIKNNASGEYIYCNVGDGGLNALIMKAAADISQDNQEQRDRAKFRLFIQPDGTFKLIPKWWAAEKPSKYLVTKNGGNDNVLSIRLDVGDDTKACWIITEVPAERKSLSELEKGSTSENVTYVKLQSATNNAYYVVPPATAGGNAIANNTDTNNNWYLVAVTDDGDEWTTYYHIRNGLTGEYLYFNGNAGDDNTFFTSADIKPEYQENYKFVIVKSASTTNAGSYNIVPKVLKGNADQTNNSLNRNNTILKTQNSRNVPASLWNIVDGDYTIAPPQMIYNAELNELTFSCTTPGVTIYYKTDAMEEGVPFVEAPPMPLTLPAGVSVIKAVAKKDGQESIESTCNVIVQTTTSDTESARRPYLIQNENNAWNDTEYNFYMIPGDDTESGNVNTSSLFSPTMEWYFKYAGTEGGYVYYDIENVSSGQYLYHDISKDEGKRIWLKESTDFSESDNGYKFRIQQYPISGTPTGYNIIPYGLTLGKMYVNKQSNNNNPASVFLHDRNDGASRWKFILKKDADMTPPFPVSGASGTTYCTIESNSSAGTYIVSPTGTSNKVTLSNFTTDDVVMLRNWYFEEDASTSTDWIKYYFIKSAVTGDYLYFTGTGFETRPAGSSTDDNYKFTWAKSPTQDTYFIVPKSRDASLNNISSVNNDRGNLNTYSSRDANGSKWKFAVSSLKVAPPHITYDAANNKVVITCTTPGATIYYTTGATSAEEPTSSSTPYSGGDTGFDLPDGVNLIRAVAVKGDSSADTQLTIPVHTSTSGTPRPYLVQSQELDFYYMIPSEPDGGLDKLNTTSLARPSMMWCFEYATTADKKHFYYIKNESTGQYVYYHDTDKISLASSLDAGNEFYMFSIDESTHGGYIISPRSAQSRWLFKPDNGTGSGNRADKDITAANNNQDKGWARWGFVPVFDRKMPTTAAPVTVSNGTYAYYQISSEKYPDYHLALPVSPATAVTTSDQEINLTKWCIRKAVQDDWLTYYYIQNAVTGEYLYLRNEGTDAIAVGAKPTDEAYQFALAKSTTGSIYIVPKSLKYNGAKTYYSLLLDKDKNPLKTANRRYVNSSDTGDDAYIKWKFEESTPSSEMPEIVYNADRDGYEITASILGSKIYYSIVDGEGNSVIPKKEYTDENFMAMSTLLQGYVISAYAEVGDGEDEDRSSEVTLTIQQVATPEITPDGRGNVEITCATADATIYYTTDGTDPVTSETRTEYTAPLTNISGKNVKAIGVKGGFVTSGVAESGMIRLTCDKPVIKRTGSREVEVTCTFPEEGVRIYYTTNGNEPTTSSGYVFSGEKITWTAESVTIKAMAWSEGYNTSSVVEKDFAAGLSGSGSDANPYVIDSNFDFTVFVNMVNGVGFTGGESMHYKVTDDISASGTEITVPFTGVFDGGLYTISGVSHALFNTVNGGKVRNVVMDGVSIGSGTNVGAICNEATGDSRIYNCGVLSSSSSVSGTANVGSIVGLLDGTSRVVNCYSYATVSGGSMMGGIVGNNSQTSTMSDLKTIVVNCMFYGEITGSGYPVYGGQLIDNYGTGAINNYNYYRESAAFDDNYGGIDAYHRSWPAEEKYLTRFEYYRSILNSNRQLCTFWVTDKTVATQTAADTALIAKWVLDPSIAPYPILKKWGKYPSVINADPERTWDPRTKDTDGTLLTPHWVNRSSAPAYHGKKLGTLSVKVSAGSHHAGDKSETITISLPILDMDTLNCDYGYAKVQLPYYNEVFGNPEANDWDKRYGGNYKEYVVTAWKITSVDKAGSNSFRKDWQDGYNYADRKCTNKDLYAENGGRAFAQGGYYYVPEGVTEIEIEAYWGKAFYLHGKDHALDRVNVTGSKNYGSAFTPAGTLPTAMPNDNTLTIYDDFATLMTAVKANTTCNVYEQAVVLVGNYPLHAEDDIDMGNSGKGGFTLMSADFDLDNEPDFCFPLQWRKSYNRLAIMPIRFDFLPVPELGLAMRHNQYAYAIGIFVPQGHFEITETSFMHTTQFEYMSGSVNVDHQQPLIFNGGQFEQIVTHGNADGTVTNAKTRNIILGGHVWMKRFTPGSHTGQRCVTRHCAVSVMGGDYPEFYLSGLYWTGVTSSKAYDDSPHCYVNGGRFGIMAGAGMEAVKNSVYFQIDHAVIDEFYGGGINSSNPVGSSINVTINNSLVLDKYCGGPKVGTSQAITTNATGTTFNQYFGGGNGGTNLYRDQIKDDTPTDMPVESTWNSTWGFSAFKPVSNQGGTVTYDAGKGYHAEFEFEVFNQSNGIDASAVARSYYHWAQFGTTQTGNVTNTLTGCTLENNFYGGGNLGNVSGNVTSTLTDCTVKGSAFGAGYSASIPSFPVHDRTKVTYPSRDKAGVCHNGSVGYLKDGEVVREYTWCYKNSTTNVVSPAGVVIPDGVTTSAPAFQYNGKWYCYTTVSLENLGAVSGTATLTINGNSVVGTLNGSMPENGTGNVYGGGDESAVNGNANVNITDDVKIYGNVYGGGNIGSVGTFTYNTDGKPTACAVNTGHTAVVINGKAELGPNGMQMTADNTAKRPDDAGMVYGAGRGTVDPLYDDPDYKDVDITNDAKQDVIKAMITAGTLDAKLATLNNLAYVNTSEVTIGGEAFVKGSVYGGSENGHVLDSTYVKIRGGQIGAGKGMSAPYKDSDWDKKELEGCSHWPYEGDHSPHDIFADKYDASLDTYKKFANGALNATDGHTFYGNVFGGGSGYYPYAPGKWLRPAGKVEGNTRVEITGGHILTSVYGGNEMTDVGGKCTVMMSNGTVGVPRDNDEMNRHPVICSLFGAGKGDERNAFNEWTNVGSTSVIVSGEARIFGSVFGGGEDGHVLGDAETVIKPDASDKTKAPHIGSTGTSGVDGNVFGGGRGFAEVALTAGVVCGNVTLDISGGTILGSVYGGGRLASVGTYLVPPEDKNYGKMIPDGVEQSVKVDGESVVVEGTTHGHITVNISGGKIGAGNLVGDVYAGCKGSDKNYSFSDSLGLSRITQLTISQADDEVRTVINNSVFGGGEAGDVQGAVTVNMLGGEVMNAIYGGGARSETNMSNWDATKNSGKGGWAEGKSSASDTTVVNLLGGFVGDVYGGGLGLMTSSDTIPAYVLGNVLVNLNGLAKSGEYDATIHGSLVTGIDDDEDEKTDYYLANDGCVVKGNIFGCNNVSGTPKGTSTVHVYKTKGWDGHYRTGNDVETEDERLTKLNDIDDSHHSYEVAAVYGGGNLAAYEPVDLATATTHVIIDGCDQTSIRQVYGGGNAASTPATLVDINGTYEIEEAFGGGNGKDAIKNAVGDIVPNPGANVGYYDYSNYENSDEGKTGAATIELRKQNYQYGTGAAQMRIHGGKVHRVYGGSNTKGNVRISAVTMLEDESGCPFDVDEAYGGGKSAPMDGATDLQMACIPGLKAAYGGAEDANVEGDVTLNITNGYFDRVFGGNNVYGNIGGTITVNIEETGCKPIVIGQLYGGGNLAPYTAPAGEHGPTLNVRSFTSIGEVYGGGYGSTAEVKGDTYVDINVCDGMNYSSNESLSTKVAEEIEKRKHISFYDYVIENGKIKTDEGGNRIAVAKSVDIIMPTRSGLVGAIHHVFGGGNAARVDGNTYVTIGTKSGDMVDLVSNSTTATVRGANITGSVYGGGNQADVTGKTNVEIGKKVETTPTTPVTPEPEP